MSMTLARYLTMLLVLAIMAARPSCAQRPTGAVHTGASAGARDSASRAFDALGMRAFAVESQAYIVAGDRFYEDPEDAQSVQHKFFQSSVFLLLLAVDADSLNALAEYHLGKVLARKSYTGFGTWDQDTLKAALKHLVRAQALAVGQYASVRPEITAELRQQRQNLDTLGHHPH